MSAANAHSERIQNRLLAALPTGDYARLSPALEPISLVPRQSVYEPYQPIPYVYFPTRSIISLVTLMDDGTAVEVATVGNEGMVGLPVFLGVDSSPGQAFTLVPGASVRMRADIFKAEIALSGVLRNLTHRYIQGLFNQIARSAACSRLHLADQRCARWLLTMHDGVAADEFHLTHEFFAQILGVRRATVTECAGRLQRAGVIRYHRGQIRIVNRRALEAAACSCYHGIKADFDRLLA